MFATVTQRSKWIRVAAWLVKAPDSPEMLRTSNVQSILNISDRLGMEISPKQLSRCPLALLLVTGAI